MPEATVLIPSVHSFWVGVLFGFEHKLAYSFYCMLEIIDEVVKVLLEALGCHRQLARGIMI